jgi:hypothetical protein
MPAWLYDEVWPWLLAVRWSAALTGPTERRTVQRIMDLLTEYLAANAAANAASAGRKLSRSQQEARNPYDVVADLDKVVERYRLLLARKIRRSLL